MRLSDSPLFFPPGLEKIFLLIYFISLPYITGLIFLYFYVSDSKTDIFLSLNDNGSFIMTWAIGYEILAVIALLLIIKSAISFSMSVSSKNRKFQRPV